MLEENREDIGIQANGLILLVSLLNNSNARVRSAILFIARNFVTQLEPHRCVGSHASHSSRRSALRYRSIDWCCIGL